MRICGRSQRREEEGGHWRSSLVPLFFIVVVLLLTSLIPFCPPYAHGPFIQFFATPTCIDFGSFVARVSMARAFEKRFETYTLQPQSPMRDASCQRASFGIENPTMPMTVPFDGHLNAQKAPRGDHETMLLLIPDRCCSRETTL